MSEDDLDSSGFDLIDLDTEVCSNPWCGIDLRVSGPDEAFSRGRSDDAFFWHYFLLRCPHPGQLRFCREARAQINALACSNRYGKTTLLAGRHFKKCIYKEGAEHLYLVDDPLTGELVFDLRKFRRTRYRTVHTAGEWDQASEVWEDAQKLINESPRLQMFVTNTKRAMPPHIDFLGGARWMFRTLGPKGSGIDGKNFYLLSIDEAGWISDLETMMDNVLKIRVADVRGQIDLVGTFKPGMAKDFFKTCVKAAAATGAAIGFDHRSASEGEEGEDLDAAIYRYAAECGFDLAEEIRKAREIGVID